MSPAKDRVCEIYETQETAPIDMSELKVCHDQGYLGV